MSAIPKTKVTPEEYLEIERKAEYKSEYFGGEIFPMNKDARQNLIRILQSAYSGELAAAFAYRGHWKSLK
jgi:Uma2 family endonuclease